jgi:hypothetical protein
MAYNIEQAKIEKAGASTYGQSMAQNLQNLSGGGKGAGGGQYDELFKQYEDEINRSYTQMGTQQNQELVGTGLYNSTVRPSMQAQLERYRSGSLAELYAAKSMIGSGGGGYTGTLGGNGPNATLAKMQAMYKAMMPQMVGLYNNYTGQPRGGTTQTFGQHDYRAGLDPDYYYNAGKNPTSPTVTPGAFSGYGYGGVTETPNPGNQLADESNVDWGGGEQWTSYPMGTTPSEQEQIMTNEYNW